MALMHDVQKCLINTKTPWIVTKMARQTNEDGRVGSNICKSEVTITITMTKAKQAASHAHNRLFRTSGFAFTMTQSV